jgi:hypothetical protein
MAVRVKITAYIDDKIAGKLHDNLLDISGAFSVVMAEGANRIGQTSWRGLHYVLVAYCADQAKATEVVDLLLELAEDGQEILIERADVTVVEFVAGSKR